MKKLMVLGCAALMVFAFALPAMAKVQVGGMITTDLYYWDASGENVAFPAIPSRGGTLQNGREEFQINLPNPLNRLNAKYTSDDGNIGGFIELRGGGPDSASANVIWNYGWIDWHFNPNFYLRIGRQTQAFAIHAPGQQVGRESGHLILVGFGNIHGGSARDSVRGYIKFTDNVRMEIQLMDPDNVNDEVIGGFTNTPGLTAGPFEENTLPRFDIALPMKFNGWTVEPAFTYLKQSYDQVVGGADDSLDCWGGSLFVGGGFGMFEFEGEITLGENLGDGNYVSGPGAAPAVRAIGYNNGAVPVGNNAFNDTEFVAFWLQGGFKFGAATLQLIYGYQNMQNDVNPLIPGDDVDITRQAFVVNLPIKVAKGFTVTPEVGYYDFDDSAQNGTVGGDGSPVPVDFGEVWVFGVQFQLVF